MIDNIPVLAEQRGQEIVIGMAQIDGSKICMTMNSEFIETVQKLVQNGALLKGLHINLEMLAARKKED